MTTEIKQIVEQIGAKHTEIDRALQTLRDETRGSANEAKSALTAAEKAVADIRALGNRIAEIEQKTASDVQAGKAAPETLGQMFLKSDAYKRFVEGSASKVSLEIKSPILTQDATTAAPNGTLVSADRRGVVTGPTRALRLRDVIPGGTTGSNLVEYPRELAYTNSAAETQDGQAVPESSAEFEMVSHPVQLIGHFMTVSKRVINDSDFLMTYLDGRLRYGVDVRIDHQILNGNGIGVNLCGMAKSGNHVVFTPIDGDTPLDSLNRAVEQVALADYAATGFILHPSDWGKIERMKDNTGRYLIGNPSGTVLAASLWGLPVVVTSACPVGKFFCGALDVAFQWLDRATTTISMSESDGSNFKAGLITLKAEAQIVLLSQRPGSTRFGSLEYVTP